MEFDKVLDTGKREQFDTGAIRDTEDNKPRFDLIPVEALNRLAQHYTNGAKKYGDNNWRKGLPIERCYSSALRHLYQYKMGDVSEDHLSAVVFNIFCIVTNQETKSPEKSDWIKDAFETIKENLNELSHPTPTGTV